MPPETKHEAFTARGVITEIDIDPGIRRRRSGVEDIVVANLLVIIQYRAIQCRPTRSVQAPRLKPRKRPRARRTPPRTVPVIEVVIERRHLRRQVVAVIVGVFIHRLDRVVRRCRVAPRRLRQPVPPVIQIVPLRAVLAIIVCCGAAEKVRSRSQRKGFVCGIHGEKFARLPAFPSKITKSKVICR